MDQIFAKASNQAVSFAIRSGISLASGYAIKTISKLVEKLPESEKKRMMAMKNRIQIKINILTVSIDLIKLAAARGNTTLESTVLLIEELNEQFETFDETIEQLLGDLTKNNQRETIKSVEYYMKTLLEQINDAIPIINLSLQTSGINLNGEMLKKLSPGRLIQASSYLLDCNQKPNVGPTFDLVLYTIFYNPDRAKYIDDKLSAITWKETFARCKVKIMKTEGFNCNLNIVEDFNDGRYHDEDEESPQIKNFNTDSIQGMFFTASGKLLKLDSRNSPVLIIKLVHNDLEEWIALGEKNIGEFESDNDDDDDEEEEEKEEKDQKKEKKVKKSSQNKIHQTTSSSLSLLEYLLRLSKVQQIEGKSIFEIKDEILSLYLTDTNNQTSDIAPSFKANLKKAEMKQETDTKVSLDSNITRLKNLDIK